MNETSTIIAVSLIGLLAVLVVLYAEKWPVDTEKQELQRRFNELEAYVWKLEAQCEECEAANRDLASRLKVALEALNYTEDSQQVEREEWWELLKGYAQ